MARRGNSWWGSEQITGWVAGDGEQRPLTVTKIHTLLARQGCVVPYRALHRFASERCGFGRKDTTVRVAEFFWSILKTEFYIRTLAAERPHAVYELGPRIPPLDPIPNDAQYGAARLWLLLDQSQTAASLAEAIEGTRSLTHTS
jgi:hypothetical protein